MNAFAKIRTELIASDRNMRTTDVIFAARAADGLLEWPELSTPPQAADLAKSCFDATIAESKDAAHIHLYGVDAIDRDLGTALRL
ncbi:hypothetical protein [Pseudophaeobacter sp.]|uniref:hypothetical protein n=1 Tax=Pseudophaeobacter sp. TaxID=1971739 RepID=UPI003298BD35